MKPRTYVYISGALLAALVLTVGRSGPLATAANDSQKPVFAVDPSWPNPLPAPVGADGAAHPWVTGEIAGTCIDKNDNVYTFNRGWEVGVTVNGVLQGSQGGAIVGQDAFPPSIPSPPIVEYDSDGNAIAGWSAIAKATLDRVRKGRHQFKLRSANGFWIFETFIANSTPDSKNLGIGIDPSNANSWLLRSPGILSRRVLCGFLPLRRRLLDQPSNPSHQLNPEVGARDMPDAATGDIERLVLLPLRRRRIGMIWPSA